MNTTDLIAAKVAGLPPIRQAEILRYILALGGEPSYIEPHSLERTEAILQRTWGAWGRMSREEIDHSLAAFRDEWERDLPWPVIEP